MPASRIAPSVLVPSRRDEFIRVALGSLYGEVARRAGVPERRGGVILFTSNRERRLWLCALAVVVAIYSTLGLAGTLAEVLRERNLLPASLLFLLFLLVAAIVGSGLKRRPARREIWVVLGITAVYGLAVLRMSGSPEERTHLFEYGIVAVLTPSASVRKTTAGCGCRPHSPW